MTCLEVCYNVCMRKINLPQPDDYPSRKEWEMAYWRKILKSKELLDLLITSNERHNLVMRAAVMDKLASGKRPKEITEELWLSRQTINSVKKAMAENGYKSYRERGKTERKKKAYSSDPLSRRRKYRGRPQCTK